MVVFTAQCLTHTDAQYCAEKIGLSADFSPFRSGQMVGAIPVGIDTRGAGDAPYWPGQICWTYEEVWTQRWVDGSGS